MIIEFIHYCLYPKLYPNTEKVNIKEFIVFGILISSFAYLVIDPTSTILGGSVAEVGILSASPDLIFSALLIAPFFEEIVHRGFLTVKSFYFIPFILSLLFIAIKAYFAFGIIPPVILGLCFIGFLLSLVWGRNLKKLIIVIFRKNFRIYFYAVAFVFSVLHLTTADLQVGLIFCLFKVFIEFLPVAILLGYLRVRYGLSTSIAFHALNNALTLLLNQWIYIGLT